jgi:hypothetical protein
MENKNRDKKNEDGFVMVASLLILLVLTLLGIAVNQNSETEWRIAMNDRLQKETFYRADAASELTAEVLEQSIACLGFPNSEEGKVLNGYSRDYNVYIESHEEGFWRYYAPDGVEVPNNDKRHMVFPAVVDNGTFNKDQTDARPHANINVGGNTRIASGSAIQMAAGYEGLGQGISSGGSMLLYSINVQQVDPVNGGEATVCVQYGHIMGTAGVCNGNL